MEKTKRKLSIGVTIVAIIMLIFGIMSFSDFLTNRYSLGFLIWAILYILSAVGLLRQKFWGLRIAQVTFIFSLIVSPLFLILFESTLTVRTISFLVYIGIIAFFLWYLTRKHVVRQFIEIQVTDSNKTIDGNKTEKKYLEEEQELGEQRNLEEKRSLRPVFSGIFNTIGFILWYGGQIILLVVMIYYFFEWFGRWAWLLVVGGLLGIPFIGFLFNIITFAPIFPIILWIYTKTFPLWYFVIWGASIVGMIIVSRIMRD